MNVENKDIFILEIRKRSNFFKHIEQFFFVNYWSIMVLNVEIFSLE